VNERKCCWYCENKAKCIDACMAAKHSEGLERNRQYHVNATIKDDSKYYCIFLKGCKRDKNEL